MGAVVAVPQGDELIAVAPRIFNCRESRIAVSTASPPPERRRRPSRPVKPILDQVRDNSAGRLVIAQLRHNKNT